MESRHPWRARLGVGIAMLLLSFIGMVTTQVDKEGSWGYWKWIVPVYAALALWLSWYMRRTSEVLSSNTLGHEALHWGAVIGAVFMVSHYANLGTISRFVEGLFDITLLSLGIFLAGVYIESTFLFIGMVLACFAVLSAAVVQYLYAYMVPVILGVALIITLMIYIANLRSKK